jgi:hypothetical protein
MRYSQDALESHERVLKLTESAMDRAEYIIKTLLESEVSTRADSQEVSPFQDSIIQRPVYHGSSEIFYNFERRKSYRTVLFSQFDVESPAHFFANTPEEAAEYGRRVSSWYIDIKRPLFNAENPRDISISSKDSPEDIREVRVFLLHLKKILRPMIEKKDGIPYIDVGVKRYLIDPKDAWWPLLVFDETNGPHWDVLDNPECVKNMVSLGYDGTTVDEDNGHSWAIFSPEQARFIGRVDI